MTAAASETSTRTTTRQTAKLTRAGPARKNRKPPPPPEIVRDRALAVLDNDQAIDVRLLDMRQRGGFTDYMIIASGRAQRHMAAMADHLSQTLKAAGVRGLAVEGLRQGDWVLLDAGDVVIHLFRPEVRAYYDLERLWDTDLPAANQAPPNPPTDSPVSADSDPSLADSPDV